MSMLGQIGWTAWALAPVVAMAVHFGPGQRWLLHDDAARLQGTVQAATDAATADQATAYALHRRALDARRRAFLSEDATDATRAAELTRDEEAAYLVASDAWARVADLYRQLELLTAGSDHTDRVRLLRGGALVRAGQIFDGIGTLDELVARRDATLGVDDDLTRVARSELAAAHYYGARILRLRGRPDAQWRAVSGRARQHYRYLAERAADRGETVRATTMQRNLELVLDLEQRGLEEVQGRPLPKDSPRARRPGDGEPDDGRGRSRRPPRQPDGRGAGGTGAIGEGW